MSETKKGTVIFENDEKKKKIDHYIRSLLAYDNDIAAFNESKSDFKRSIRKEAILSKDEIALADKAYSMIRASNPVDIDDLNHTYELVDKIIVKGPYTQDELGLRKDRQEGRG